MTEPVGGLVDRRLVVGVVVLLPQDAAALVRGTRRELGLCESEIPAHVTLLPPTDVDAGQLRDIEEHLAKVAGTVAPFGVRLVGTGSFRPVTPVAYLRVVQGVGAFDEAQREVRTGPLARELTFPYHPHATIAHTDDDAVLDAAAARLAGVEIAFTATGFVLYTKTPDGAWRRRGSFGLTG